MRNKEYTYNIRRLWPSIMGFSLLEVAAIYPFVLLLTLYALHIQPMLLLILLWIYHVCGSLIGMRQARGSGVHIMVPLIFVSALLLAVGIYGLRIHAVLVAVLLLVAAGRGLIAGRKQIWQVISWPLPMIGIGAALVLYIAASKAEAMLPYRLSLYGCCMITLVVFLLRLNSGQVRNVSFQEQTDRLLLSRILSANRWMTWVVILAIALLSAWNKLGILLIYIRDLVLTFLNSLGDQQPPAAPVEDQQKPMMPNLGQGTVEPMWLRIISDVLVGLLALAAAVAIVVLLYRLFSRWIPRRIREWIHRIGQWIGLLRSIRRISENAESELFVDEVEKLTRVPSKPRKLRIKRSGAEYTGDDPRRAYQELIRRAIKRGFTYRASRTPAENGAVLIKDEGYTELPPERVKQLVERYNVVRYGTDE